MSQPLGRIIVVSPFEHPDAALVVAASRAGALGVLDLGRDPGAARSALARLAGEPEATLGVRVPSGVTCEAASLPPSVGTVVVDAGVALAPWRGLRVLVQVTSLAEAQAAYAAGAAGLIAKGNECGGRVGDATSFVLLQALVDAVPLPVWVQGGVGLHTASACVAGGAAGVVLDAQVALAREATLPAEVRQAVAAMDGSETVLIDGHRVFTRPDLPVRDIAAAGAAHAQLGCNLRTQLLAAGQDAAFAKSLAERFRTVGGIVRGIVAAIDHDVALARRQRALAENSPLARDLHIRYPLFQGPMTRVSDRAQFAEAVAAAGGLPFLALALMRGPEVEALLAETAARLAGKMWGVGVLGFVPAELREEQLEVVRRWKPPVALIAGGRPAQAKPLEELGIATFLHTPSPGLLDLFLKQGARRFVFEGSECGGHVGPRTSFALWEAQIERLLAHPAPEELEVVFAGGIHDARSAAMVAAMSAPLAERGTKIGVLMGTAYLFTQEAVACGAIQPGFQQAAIECTQTVLLETAPGHSTRCADTDYVRMFRAERERLAGEGLPAHEVWQRLEELNLGRLRIAAKGLQRDGDKLVTVDAPTQRREGMVMLGQVAALHDKVMSVADLHDDVAAGAVRYLAALPAMPSGVIMPRAADVAIIGMATIMPGAPDLAAFWGNIVNGVNSIGEVPAERWRAETFYDPNSMNGEMTPSKWGGFLDPYPFDPLTYGIPPNSLAAIEPMQLLALEVSRKALQDAGYLDREFDRERTSVIFGAESGTDLSAAYGFRSMWRSYIGALPPELAAVLPTLTEDSFPGILANVIAGRVANRLDLGGANYTVDAACASSLAAVDLACKELVAGTSNMVICGGADLHNSIGDYLVFASVHALSPTGQCRTFDASADGIALGEGVVAVVLKRLADAQRDGDRIYAVVKGVGSGSDGKSLGLTAPRTQGQTRTLARAYEQAGVRADEVGLVEAHGTGTVVGDRTELETLNNFFGGAGAASGSIALGSIKSQIGHTKCAAGLAGVVKTAMSLYHRVLPPTLNITRPNPGWSTGSPFHFASTARPWATRGRLAGVSAFGFGGTNFHVVLAEHELEHADAGVAAWPAELFLIRGRDRTEAGARLDELEQVLGAGERPLRNIAASVARQTGPVQAAIVASTMADLRHKISLTREWTAHASGVFVASATAGGDAAPKIAFLFPGQGSQRVGMQGDLFIAFPWLQRYLELGARWKPLMFPPTAWTPEEAEAQRVALTDTRVAQPALGAAGLALAD
ncbi:MAG: beta-ketoacyl synthase N-terminal-like domain-containing protein, partial [Betaproteobacteria bacterium]